MVVFDHPSGYLKALQVAEGFHSTQHCFNNVCRAYVAYECGLVQALHRELLSNWARAFNKIAHSHSLRSSLGVVHEQFKTLCRSTGGGGDCIGSGGAKWQMGAMDRWTKAVDGWTGLANKQMGPADGRTKEVKG